MALAIFNSTILNLHFPKALYKKICGEPLKFDDYAEIYPETAQNLQKLLEYDGDDFSEVFALNFETTFINDMWEINPKNIKNIILWSYVRMVRTCLLHQATKKNMLNCG